MNSQLLQNIIEYKKKKRILSELELEFKYLDTLLKEARKVLSLKELDELIDFIAKIRKKLDYLEDTYEKLKEEVKKIEPEHVKKILEAQQLLLLLKESLTNFFNKNKSLKDVLGVLTVSSEKLLKLAKELKNVLKEFNQLLEQATQDQRAILEDEKRTIVNVLGEITFFILLANPPVKIIENAWNLLGYKAIIGVSEDAQGIIVSGVYITKNLKNILLEILREKIATPDIFNKLFPLIGIEFSAKNAEDLKQKILEELNVDEEKLLITTLRDFLKEKNLLSRKVSTILKPEYERVGFLIYKPTETTIDHEKRVIAASEKLLKKYENVFKAPALKIFNEKEILGAQLTLDEHEYIVQAQTLIPTIGFCLVLLKRDINKEPEPSIQFVRHLLNVISKYRQNVLLKLGKIDKTDPIWGLRLIIMRGLKELDITERTALRPSNLFSFCLKYKLPILYEEILENYLHVIPTEYIDFSNSSLKLKVPIEPIPISRAISKQEVLEIVGRDFIDVLGVTLAKGKTVVHLAKKLDEEHIRKIAETYNINPKILKRLEDNPKKILKLLLYQGKIGSLNKYREVEDELGIVTIDLKQLLTKIYKNVEEYVRAYFLQRVQWENLGRPA
ncbi:MAG: hypothetical protein ACTSX9_04400 [Candidatus Njordarchaeales archaeon]